MTDERLDDTKVSACGQENPKKDNVALLDRVAAAIEKLPWRFPDRPQDAAFFARENALYLIQCSPPGPLRADVNSRVHKQLSEFEKAAEKLLQAMAAMEPETLEVLTMHEENSVKDQLEMALHRAWEFRRFWSPPQSVPGAPQKANEASFTDAIGRVFGEQTGRIPKVDTNKANKASGRYYELVKEIFDIFRIKASPESQARAAADRVKEIIPEKLQ